MCANSVIATTAHPAIVLRSPARPPHTFPKLLCCRSHIQAITIHTMATQLAQRSSTLGSSAAAQKRAAAPRAPFSSHVIAQLKQVRPRPVMLHNSCSRQPTIALKLVFPVSTQAAKAVSAAQQPIAQRSVKAQVRAPTPWVPNAAAQHSSSTPAQLTLCLCAPAGCSSRPGSSSRRFKLQEERL